MRSVFLTKLSNRLVAAAVVVGAPNNAERTERSGVLVGAPKKTPALDGRAVPSVRNRRAAVLNRLDAAPRRAPV